MTRKDYILIAKALRNVPEPNDGIGDNDAWFSEGFGQAVDAIANAFAEDNPRFDREHFLAVVNGERELQSRPARGTCKATADAAVAVRKALIKS